MKPSLRKFSLVLFFMVVTFAGGAGIAKFIDLGKWDCDPPISIGYLATIQRNPTIHDGITAIDRALITLDNGREFVVYGNPDVTLPGLSYIKGDEVFEKKGSGCMGQFVSFGNKDYWYSVLH